VATALHVWAATNTKLVSVITTDTLNNGKRIIWKSGRNERKSTFLWLRCASELRDETHESLVSLLRLYWILDPSSVLLFRSSFLVLDR